MFYCIYISLTRNNTTRILRNTKLALRARTQVHYDGLTPMTEDTLDPGAGYVITLAPNDGRVDEMGIMSTGTFGLSIPALKNRTSGETHFWGECTIPDDVPAEGVTVLYVFLLSLSLTRQEQHEHSQ